MSFLDDSRRLTGPNLYFSGAGAALETMTGPNVPDALLDAWRERIARARSALGWVEGAVVVRRHASGCSLAFEAPADRLYAAAEVNEWAWLAALGADGIRVEDALPEDHPPIDDEAAALDRLRNLASAEAHPRVHLLAVEAERRGLPAFIDDEMMSVGAGVGSRAWALDDLPPAPDVPWDELGDIPTALVTGSNGKTTTVRTLAAICAATGARTAHSCTDGLYLNGALLEEGDYSGPGGARTLVRHPEVEIAILETARGGLLRRGLAVNRAPVAVVTNVSPDHYGEYGIHDLNDLAEVKLTLARAIDDDGLLVLNADDERLRLRGPELEKPLAWFALDDEHPTLRDARAAGRPTCGVDANGRLRLSTPDGVRDLGGVSGMPITLGGNSLHNVANVAAAALAASALGIASETIASVLARFGAERGDNPGRMRRWTFHDVSHDVGGETEVYFDFAHNPDGLAGLLDVATRQRRGRLALILGQAGDRGDTEIRELATTAARFHPDLVVLKEMAGYERGRASGEVPGILRGALTDGGVPADAVIDCPDEFEAVRTVLSWAESGDVLVLPVHTAGPRARVPDLLDRMHSEGWLPGLPVPVD